MTLKDWRLGSGQTLRFDKPATVRSDLQLTLCLKLLACKHYSCVSFKRIGAIASVAIVLDIWLIDAHIVIRMIPLKSRLQLHHLSLAQRFLRAKGLQLGQSVLPVELSTLLLPLTVSLHLFLLLIRISESPNLLYRTFAFALRVFSQFD